jgi:hypothetical protein
MRFHSTVFLMVSLLLTGCNTMKPEDFANSQQRLILEKFFAGKTHAWGLFEDRFGNVKRQFTVDIDGEWDGEHLTLNEHFLYNDGETDQRTWNIHKLADGTYQGEAADVVGTARGESAGNALNWCYVMDLKVGDGTVRVSFNDWMFLQPGDVIINRAHVRKWGVEVGAVSLFFKKPDGKAPS